MAVEAQKAKKPAGPVEPSQVSQGQQKPAQAEVSGHVHGVFSCWNCDAVNYVNNNLNGFICWNCYAVNITGF